MRLSGKFQACLFVYEKILHAQKAPNPKQMTFTLLEICACNKLLPLLFSVCLILFCWLMFACDVFFVLAKSFRKKKKKKKKKKKTGLKLF